KRRTTASSNSPTEACEREHNRVSSGIRKNGKYARIDRYGQSGRYRLVHGRDRSHACQSCLLPSLSKWRSGQFPNCKKPAYPWVGVPAPCTSKSSRTRRGSAAAECSARRTACGLQLMVTKTSQRKLIEPQHHFCYASMCCISLCPIADIVEPLGSFIAI